VCASVRVPRVHAHACMCACVVLVVSGHRVNIEVAVAEAMADDVCPCGSHFVKLVQDWLTAQDRVHDRVLRVLAQYRMRDKMAEGHH